VKRLPREFFDRPSTHVAPDLLGCVLWHDTAAGLVAVRLVEVEAYEGTADPASHAFRGRTARNSVMFGPPGYAYVYFTYGMHFCVNLVCQPAGRAEAVLIRAGEVVGGAALAGERRHARRPVDLARGPGRLCQALGIDRALDGADVCGDGSVLGIGPRTGPSVSPAEICSGPRVGISVAADRPWRYWLKGDRHVSAYRVSKPREPRPTPGEPQSTPTEARPKPVSGSPGTDGTMLR
jgi:DNA-3-methyladenine glycosylase